MTRPRILLSVATSLDGYIDDSTGTRLVLSNDADLDRVDEVRAGMDAILVGAGTIRLDDPRLAVRSDRRRASRSAAGRTPSPLPVVLSSSGELSPTARVFSGVRPLVYTATRTAAATAGRLGARAEVIPAGDPPELGPVLADLVARGVATLLVEGGSAVHTEFLTAGLVDELHVALAPFFVGDPRAPRFVGPGTFPQDAGHRMALVETRSMGDVALLRYQPKDAPR